MTIEVRAASRTDVGKARERNEDACFVGTNVFAVADGLGGHRAGEVASNLALQPVAELDGSSARVAADRIATAVRKGNRAVYEHAQKDAELKGMGTTVTAVAVHDGIAHVAHVGDSRCYLIRGAEISQLSRDHTLVARMVAEGKLSPEQAEAHPQRSILTRALGHDRDVDVDELKVSLLPGDRLVLCSDGLSGVLSDEEIRTLGTDGADLDEICQALIDEANARGGPDNITAIVVDVGGTLPPGRVPGPLPTTPALARRRFPVRALVWVTLLAALVLGGIVGVRAWANRTYYLGVDGTGVAIFQGLPIEVVGLRFSHVEERTDLRVGEVRNPAVRRSLREGAIRASSLEDARRKLDAQVRVHTRAEPPAIPSPTAGPSPTGTTT